MKATNAVRDRSQIGVIDYALTSFGTCLAVYSAGMAVGVQAVGIFSASLVLVGTLCSYLIRVLARKSSLLTVDGIVYAGAVLLAIILVPRLNQLMPESGFPQAVIIAAILTWMVILGSFCMWRDGTLLFQAIPSIALFGLVGCYDTYRSVTFSFFGFLICLATLFARAHTREMLQQAVDSGYFSRADSPGRSSVVEKTMALYVRMKEGPWRWLAGPEWALVSALVVVMVSLLGAPVIQQSAQQFSGFVRVPAPPQKPSVQPSVVVSSSGADTRIGQGASLSETPVYEATMDRARYLRAATYDIYTGDGWRSSLSMLTRDPGIEEEVWPDVAGRDEMVKKTTISFNVRPLRPTSLIPVPGEVTWLDAVGSMREHSDGTFEIVNPIGDKGINGKAEVAAPGNTPSRAVTELPSTLIETASLNGITDKIKEFARGIAKQGHTDYEKATLLQQTIEGRCMYNLHAPAPPAGKDAAENFLFDERQGYCDSFATAMVLMARSVGIPARYVTGYLPDPANQDSAGRYVIRQKDAHAWAELFFKGAGWVVFDATEGAAIAPGGNDDGSGGNWLKGPIVSTILDVLIGIAVLAAIALALRSLRPALNPNRQRSETERLYVRYADLLQRKSRKRRDPSLTPDEFLALARPSLNGSYEGAKALNERFVRLLYGPAGISDDDVARLKLDLRKFETKLRKEPVPR